MTKYKEGNKVMGQSLYFRIFKIIHKFNLLKKESEIFCRNKKTRYF